MDSSYQPLSTKPLGGSDGRFRCSTRLGFLPQNALNCRFELRVLHSSLLQEMGGASAMESVAGLPGICPCNVRLPAGTNELLLDVVLRTNMK